MLSLLVWPKVITLSGFYCICTHYFVLDQGSQTQIIGGPHSKEKMLRGPQVIRKIAFVGRINLLKTPQNKLNLTKFDQNL
jgi:hypothetical protein